MTSDDIRHREHRPTGQEPTVVDIPGVGTVIPLRPDQDSPQAAPATGPGTALVPDEAIEGELLTEAENRALDRRLAAGTGRRLPGAVWPVLATGARTGARTSWRLLRRHGAFIAKGAEAERQRRKTERQQGDTRAARAAALERGDLDQVVALNQQIAQARHALVTGVALWVDLGWSVTKKVAKVLVILVGIALAAGVVNEVGGWFGPWGITSVLSTVGTIATTVWTVLAWVVRHWWLFGLTGLGVWLFRRWKDGVRLGEQVLPEHLRRTGRRVAYVELTENAVVSALANIGNAKLTAAIKDGWPNRDTDHAWVQPPMVARKGWSTKLRLPLGASVATVNKTKDLLAHNLGCRPQELFIEPDTDDPTVMDLFRLDPGVLREPVPEYPLLNEGSTDYWTGFPVGITPRGEPVTGVVFERNYVAAGIMGSGKSTLIIDLLLGAVLDPLVDIDVFVFAENADYDVLRPCLNTFSAGDTAENVDACLDHLAGLREELNTRGRLLQQHGEFSVTRTIAAKEPELRPRIVVIDECQSFFRQDTPEARRTVVNLMVRFFSAARKYGITCIFATPVPSDQSLPRDLVSVTTNRACFAIGDKTRNNVVLGDKAHENGISALGLKPKTPTALNDVGTAITVGFTDTPGALRCYHTTRDEQNLVIERALDLRGGATGPAEPTMTERDWLADLAEVSRGHDKVRLTDAAGWLRKHAPDHRPYRSLDGKTLAAWLTGLDVPVTWPSRQPTVRTQRIHTTLTERETNPVSDHRGPNHIPPPPG